jgi:uncharacterized phage protein gp47/JayE
MLNVDGQEDVRFVNKSRAPATGTYTAGVQEIEFESVEYGPIVANADTLTVITAPVSGLNSATNPLDATLGNLREEDTPLRIRRAEEFAASGACTVDAIRAALLQVSGVKQAFVCENVTLETDGNGLPGKSFEAVVYDGETPEAEDGDIAQVIWDNKPSGGESYGATTEEAIDSKGVTQAVKFSRATSTLTPKTLSWTRTRFRPTALT